MRSDPPSVAAANLNHWAASRYDADNAGGFYESYFLRANHPSRPLAFWIRYTVFSPKGRPDLATGELWAIYFDRDKRSTTATKESFPIGQCALSKSGMDVRIGPALLTNERLDGQAASGGRSIAWSLECSGSEQPL